MFNLFGEITAPFKIDGEYTDIVYSINVTTEPELLLNENFNTISSNIWSFRSGNYRDIVYLPDNPNENAFINQNQLVIKNIKNNPSPDFEWSGAFADTKNKFQFQYGTIIARIKFPKNVNRYHATLWALGQSYGEIDISESDSGNVWASIHAFQENGTIYKSQQIAVFNVDASEYHIYQIRWTENSIKAYVDGIQCGQYNVEEATTDNFNSLRQPFYLVINSLPYSTTSKEYATAEQIETFVDFVKVYSA